MTVYKDSIGSSVVVLLYHIERVKTFREAMRTLSVKGVINAIGGG